MLPVEILRGGLEDFQDSLDWYFVENAASARAFDTAIQAALGRIAAQPLLYAVIDDPFRACPVKGFPFRIIYSVEPDRILVTAIAHTSRRGSYWRNRE